MGRRMRHSLVVCVLAIACSRLAAVCTANPADDERSGTVVSVRIDFLSRYVWRGLAWSRGPVLQPSVSVEQGPFSVTGWANVGLDRRDGSSLNEVDLILSHQASTGKLEIESCLQFFAYPDQEDSPGTGEAVVSVYYPVGPLTAYLSHAADFIHYRGAHYTEIGLAHAHELGACTTLNVTAGVSAGSRKFNDVYVGVARSAWNVVSLEVALEHGLSPGWKLRSSLAVTELLDCDLRASGVDRRLMVIGFGIRKAL